MSKSKTKIKLKNKVKTSRTAAKRARPTKSLRKSAPRPKASKALPHKRAAVSAKAVAEHNQAKQARQSKQQEQKAEKRSKSGSVNMPTSAEARRIIEEIYNNNAAIEYLRKNVSKYAMDVLTMLENPQTDEFIAEQLNMKVNAIRRILNITQGYGITNYYVAKNTGGWLSFAWYINVGKAAQFFDYINNANTSSVINGACDDYFICNSCYKNDKLIFVFESAYEIGFKCGCGKNMTRVGRQEASQLIQTGSIENLQQPHQQPPQQSPTIKQ